MSDDNSGSTSSERLNWHLPGIATLDERHQTPLARGQELIRLLQHARSIHGRKGMTTILILCHDGFVIAQQLKHATDQTQALTAARRNPPQRRHRLCSQAQRGPSPTRPADRSRAGDRESICTPSRQLRQFLIRRRDAHDVLHRHHFAHQPHHALQHHLIRAQTEATPCRGPCANSRRRKE